MAPEKPARRPRHDVRPSVDARIVTRWKPLLSGRFTIGKCSVGRRGVTGRLETDGSSGGFYLPRFCHDRIALIRFTAYS